VTLPAPARYAGGTDPVPTASDAMGFRIMPRLTPFGLAFSRGLSLRLGM